MEKLALYIKISVFCVIKGEKNNNLRDNLLNILNICVNNNKHLYIRNVYNINFLSLYSLKSQVFFQFIVFFKISK
jgi:hypothetical protein